jgi:hypothetical protein
MGTRASYPPFNVNQCAFCPSKYWTGFWLGTDLVQVCRPCAIHVLPALLADATWLPDWTPEIGRSDWIKIENAFWHAQTLNVLRASKVRDFGFNKALPMFASSLRSNKGGKHV